MKKNIISKGNILNVCKKIVSNKGLAAVNMREVSKECNISLGLVYYYFPSKDDLLIATIESVWDDIFNWEDEESKNSEFTSFIDKLFEHIKRGIDKYPNFFTIHSVSFSSKRGKKGSTIMKYYLSNIKKRVSYELKKDKKIRKDAFTKDFSEEGFIDIILTNIVSLLIERDYDSSFLVEMIRRSIY